uniref:Kappa-casein n=1 Tax=Castor canadensis TaxID=51338 RepID=A0A8B7TJX4_CASCN|nr:kappa-casein [Castor canadensis]
MKRFLLVVNILALTLTFLTPEVQNQAQLSCHKNDERLSDQKRTQQIPIHYVLNNNPLYQPNYYQHRQPVSINNPYMPYPYYVISNPYMSYPYYSRLLVFGPHAQISKWQILPNIPQSAMIHRPYPRPSFIATPPKKIQNETDIPIINTIATVEPTPVPTTVPAVSTVIIPEASSQFANAPETTTVPVTPTVV